MTIRFVSYLCLVATVIFGLPLAAAGADASVVRIELQDASTRSDITGMRMVLDHATVKAGPVRLVAVNESKALVHESLVIRDTGKPLPYDKGKDLVKEGKIRSLGEIPELDPGKTGRHTFDLTPGVYLLFCNQPDHYKQGMSAKLTVEK